MLLKTILVAFIPILLLFNICLAGEDFPFLAEVNADNINIRIDSTAGSSIICVVNKNEQVEVITSAYDWYKIRLPERASAYIKKDLLECVGYSEIQNICGSAKVLKEIVNVRFGASESSPIIGKIRKNEIVRILAESSSWCKVRPPLNCFGWINKKFVRKVVSSKESQPQKKPIKDAAKEAGCQDIIIIEGRILPKTIKRIASHKIVDKDKRLYLLKSDKIGLNFFNHQKVKITGWLIDQAKPRTNSIINVEKIEVVS
ncbi:MAG: SH3 domain-containing protein [Candidatus Omnitrophota bacterium]|nr:SH3 domain-containing protein [Candidatus Omnitrophota bacterium]